MKTNTVKAILGLCLAGAMFVSGCGRSETENSTVVPQSTADTTVQGTDATKKPVESNAEAVISKDEAKNAALSHAGVSEADTQRYKSHLEYEDGVQVYEIEFSSQGYDYDYEIDAKTGDILTFDKEPV